MSIFVPPSLNNLSSLPKLADAISILVDPVARKNLETDIKNFHALNDTEAKNAEDAKALIKQNLQAVEDAKKITLQNASDKATLQSQRLSFAEEKRQEYQKIADAKLPANEALVRAQELRDEAKKIQDDVAARENALSAAKTEHEKNISKFEEDKATLATERQTLEDQKQALIELDRQTKAKVEALKKFNF